MAEKEPQPKNPEEIEGEATAKTVVGVLDAEAETWSASGLMEKARTNPGLAKFMGGVAVMTILAGSFDQDAAANSRNFSLAERIIKGIHDKDTAKHEYDLEELAEAEKELAEAREESIKTFEEELAHLEKQAYTQTRDNKIAMLREEHEYELRVIDRTQAKLDEEQMKIEQKMRTLNGAEKVGNAGLTAYKIFGGVFGKKNDQGSREPSGGDRERKGGGQ